ncbi:MAG TPA: TIGR03435 family protein [Acidobacteriaceae bacterium]|jgi:uncharacterized protein (TIGR03435 family)
MLNTKPQTVRCSLHKLLLVAATTLFASAASGQIVHKGPANAIALAAKLSPYDVVSIKINNSQADNGGMNIDDHGRFTVTNMPLQSIIEFAYDVKESQISGLTGPAESARFDVEAKLLPPEGVAPTLQPTAELLARIILLLADRFHFQAHLQPKIMPVYELVVAHGGPKIKLSQDELKENSWNINGENTEKVLTCKGASMPDLASALSDEAGREVLDKTGLAGHADITLKWSDDVAQTAGGPNVISIFTAVEDQLGLKLQSAKGPVDTLVIDHVEMPTAD